MGGTFLSIFGGFVRNKTKSGAHLFQEKNLRPGRKVISAPQT
jgi:hypothetical protein